MKKISITAKMTDLGEIYKGLKLPKGAPEDIQVEVEMDDIPQNYEFLCKSSLIKEWKFVEEPEPKELALTLSDCHYEKVKKEFEDHDINMKDIRDIIMISYSLFCVTRMENRYPQLSDVITYYLVNKDRIKEKVYSEEFISNTIMALSKTDNPLKDFLGRLVKAEGVLFLEDATFDIYYKALYGPEK